MRVVIAEDSVLLREGVARLLADRGHDVLAQVGDADALVIAVREHLPDVAVVDVRMPPTHTDEGIRAAVQLHDELPDVGMLVLSQYVEERYAALLLERSPAGVGYLLKDRVADVREFLDALDRVARGGTALDPDVVAQVMGRSRRRDTLDQLTPRERDVLQAMAEGRSNTGIARALSVGEGAVEKHISSIFAKLGVGGGADDHRRVLAVLRLLGS